MPETFSASYTSRHTRKARAFLLHCYCTAHSKNKKGRVQKFVQKRCQAAFCQRCHKAGCQCFCLSPQKKPKV